MDDLKNIFIFSYVVYHVLWFPVDDWNLHQLILYKYSKYPSKSNSCKIELVQGIVNQAYLLLRYPESNWHMQIQPLNSQVHALVARSLGHSIW